MIINWGLAFELQTPFADIDINAADSVGVKFVPALCSARYSVRSSKDNVPQADGSILHYRFKTGYELALTIDLYSSSTQVACGEDITELGEALDGALSSLLNPPDLQGRLVWTPDGAGTLPGARMFQDLALLEAPQSVIQEGGAIRTQFVLDCPWPYAIDESQQTISINGTVVIDMEGTAEFYPVMKVLGGGGGVNNFIISNVTQGKALSYDGQTIPAGEYLEINTFKNTAFLNGDEANYLDGFDVELTDFFTLSPGANQIDTNTTVEFLVNNAYS